MRFGDYLEKKQPLVYRTFANAIENKRLAHAYLLCGESGTPLLETAKYMAKSLICDNPNPLACEECRSCGRIDHGTYMDFHILGEEEDGTDQEGERLSKEDMLKMQKDKKKVAKASNNMKKKM